MAVIQSIDAKVWLALRSGFSGWTETAIHWPDEKFSPNAAQAFLIIDPVGLDYDESSLSYDCGEELRGFLNVRVMTPVTWDYAQATGLMGRLANTFPAGRRFTYQDAVVTVHRRPVQFSGTIIETAWHRKDLRIYYSAWG